MTTQPNEPIFQAEREALALRGAAREAVTATEAKLASVLDTLKSRATSDLVLERETLLAALEIARGERARIDAETAPACAAAERVRARARYTASRDAEAAAREAVEQSLRELAQLEIGLRRHIQAIRAARDAHAEAASAVNAAADAVQSIEGVTLPRAGAFNDTSLHQRRVEALMAAHGIRQALLAPPAVTSWISF